LGKKLKGENAAKGSHLERALHRLGEDVGRARKEKSNLVCGKSGRKQPRYGERREGGTGRNPNRLGFSSRKVSRDHRKKRKCQRFKVKKSFAAIAAYLELNALGKKVTSQSRSFVRGLGG